MNIVKEISKINFQGNIIPTNWFKHIIFENGKPNTVAIIILSEIIYWYRQVEVRDEATGQIIEYRKRFKADKLQRSYQSFANQYGFTKRQVQDAIKQLVKLKLITIEFRTIETNGIKFTNVMFIEPVPETIKNITFDIDTPPTIERNTSYVIDKKQEVLQQNVTPSTIERNTSYDRTGEVIRLNVDPPAIERETNTENTTKNTTEITTEITTDINTSNRDTVDIKKNDINTSDTSNIYSRFLQNDSKRFYVESVKTINFPVTEYNDNGNVKNLNRSLQSNIIKGIGNIDYSNSTDTNTLSDSLYDKQIDMFFDINKPVDQSELKRSPQNKILTCSDNKLIHSISNIDGNNVLEFDISLQDRKPQKELQHKFDKLDELAKENRLVSMVLNLAKEIKSDKNKENVPAENNNFQDIHPVNDEEAKRAKVIENNDIQRIFDYWNSKGIIVHRKMTDKIKRAINGALKDYTFEEITTAIENYAQILFSNDYYFSYEWTLKDFLQRGLEKFMDLNIAKKNYKKSNIKAENKVSAIDKINKFIKSGNWEELK